MRETRHPDRAGGAWTRSGFLRAVLGGGAVVAGGGALGATGDATSVAAQSAAEASILNLFLKLEYAQEAFYEQAVKTGRLEGPLLDFARTAGGQEAKHAAFLKQRLGRRAEKRPKSDAGDLVRSAESFRSAAVDLEEAVIAAYIGQGANLSGETRRRVGTVLSVEARQAAWIRDLAGVSPAPRAADVGRKGQDVLRDLRDKGLLA